MTNNKELVLVHAAMHPVHLQQSVNIMLTPQFYTVKKEALPVKYAYQAKKIAPSLFDGLLDDEGRYEYLVFKEERDEESLWVYVAYDLDKITDFLEGKGIESDKVAKIFFAEQSVEDFRKRPLALGEYDALTVIDDTVVVVPSAALGDAYISSSHFSNDFMPKTAGIKAKNKPTEASDLIGQTQALSLAAILALFAGMFIVEGSRYSGDGQGQTEELERLYEEHSYLQSSYTRDAAMEKYKRIDTKERLKREAVKTCSKMIFKGVTLSRLTVDDTHIVCQFSCKDSVVASRAKDLAKKSQDFSFSAKGDTVLTVEAKL